MARGEIRFEDLPIAVRHRIQDSRREKLAREKPEKPGARLFQCCACGHVSRSWAAAERHCDSEAHYRVELVLAVDTSPE